MVSVFKILQPKYMRYLLYFKNKIQHKQSFTTTTKPVQRKVTMSHEVQSALLHKTLFGNGYCSVRWKNSVRDIHLAAPGRKNNRLLFRHPDE